VKNTEAEPKKHYSYKKKKRVRFSSLKGVPLNESILYTFGVLLRF